jgi:hypothetical protein
MRKASLTILIVAISGGHAATQEFSVLTVLPTTYRQRWC